MVSSGRSFANATTGVTPSTYNTVSRTTTPAQSYYSSDRSVINPPQTVSYNSAYYGQSRSSGSSSSSGSSGSCNIL